MTDDPAFRPETHSTVESLLSSEVAQALATVNDALTKDGPGGRIWINTEQYEALALITRELERGARVEAAAYMLWENYLLPLPIEKREFIAAASDPRGAPAKCR